MINFIVKVPTEKIIRIPCYGNANIAQDAQEKKNKSKNHCENNRSCISLLIKKLYKSQKIKSKRFEFLKN